MVVAELVEHVEVVCCIEDVADPKRREEGVIPSAMGSAPTWRNSHVETTRKSRHQM
jgi:hypothetical protein